MPLENDTIYRLAIVLLHFLWQGVVIAALGGAAMRLGRKPTARYAVGCAALALMLAAPVATWVWTYSGVSPSVSPSVSSGATPGTASLDPSAGSALVADRLAGSASLSSAETWLETCRQTLARFAPWMVGAWALGAVLLLARQTVAVSMLIRMRRRCVQIVDETLLRRCRRIAHLLYLDMPVTMLRCDALDSPAVVGWIRPAILWPAALMTGLTPVQLDALLAHELAHIRRQDYLVNLLQCIVEALLFYHPCVWWLNQRIRAEREHCCDDFAAELMGDRVAYARSLTVLEEKRQSPVFAMAANSGSLISRVRRLIAPAPSSRPSPAALGAVAVCGVTLLLLAMASWGSASEQPPSTQPAATITNVVEMSPQPTTAPSTMSRSASTRIDDAIASTAAQAEESVAPQPEDPAPTFETASTSTPRLATPPTDVAPPTPPTALERLRAAQRDRAEVAAEIERTKKTATAEQLSELEGLLAKLDADIASQTRPAGDYYVYGSVQKPGVYSMTGKKISLVQALILAGGPQFAEAFPGAPTWIKVQRRDGNDEPTVVLSCQWSELRSGKVKDIVLSPDDIVHVTTDLSPLKPAR